MILHLLERLNAGLRASWLRRSIDNALALHRTEVRSDGLRREEMSLRLLINWRARDLHPWDLDLVGHRRAVRLVEQTFSDTVAALERLFVGLPEVDVIDFKVLETDLGKHGTLLKGSITRRDFETWHPSSAVMRLKLLGVNYNLVDSQFIPLDRSSVEDDVSNSESTTPLAAQPFNSAVAAGQPGNEREQAWHQDKAGPH
jgi:hypothetical protein